MNRSSLLALFAVVAIAPVSALAQWVVQESGTRARLRGLSVVNDRVVWASGTTCTVVRTVDGGTTWRNVSFPESERPDLDLRDIHAFDDQHAFTLSIGPGDQSRVYQTRDGGKTWARVFTNPDADGFLDALAFWDEKRGLLLGDPVEGRFTVFRTEDGGQTWDRVTGESMPASLKGEGAFAASGTCLFVRGGGLAWFGTGGSEKARVFRSDDWGKTWTPHDTPISAGAPSAGIFSLAFLNGLEGVAVGGDYQKPGHIDRNVAITPDGGRTWRPHAGDAGSDVTGFRSAVGFFLSADLLSSIQPMIAVGPNGTDVSRDHGRRWRRVSDKGLHAVGGRKEEALWGVGDDGLIVRWRAR